MDYVVIIHLPIPYANYSVDFKEICY